MLYDMSHPSNSCEVGNVWYNYVRVLRLFCMVVASHIVIGCIVGNESTFLFIVKGYVPGGAELRLTLSYVSDKSSFEM